MAFRKIKDLAVVTGTYQSNGETKKRYANIGALMEGDNGQFLMLNAHFNPAGVPRKDGSESILVSMFDPKDRDTSQQPQSGGGRGSAGRGDPFGAGGDEVPF
jgi:hypothetical protein